MKLTILSVLLCFSQLTFAGETFVIPFENGDVLITADLKLSASGSSFDVQDVEVEVPGGLADSLHLVSEFGWGDEPYNFLCEQIGKQAYSADEFKYASAYGYAKEFGLFSGVLSTVKFFIVNRDKTFSISESYPNQAYDSGFSCSNTPVEY